MHETIDCTALPRGCDIFVLKMSVSSDPLSVEFKVTGRYMERLFLAMNGPR